ncbi:DUF4040 domain-containing protein [Rothia sp. AR01]|uniref:DUF4040 domain-containing protein n=1 Tax=Rothia santali TaxID=2949643 RepID=A0A9X2KI05_9MICC|nr:MnhB domain-containing protein [Rothia santali]MCP3425723.1 DUF4040 domain-containing protein [Rothia santali]
MLDAASPHQTAGLLDLVLAGCVLVGVVVSLFGRSRRAQAMAFLCLGVFMTFVWMRLGSVDVALAEAGIGTGLLSALLVHVAAGERAGRRGGSVDDSTTRDDRVMRAGRDARGSGIPRGDRGGRGDHGGRGDPGGRTARAGRAVTGLLAGGVVAVTAVSVWTGARHRLPGWEGEVGERLPGGVSHEVTGVLLDFRAYDTLLESAVLMVAGFVVLALGRDGAPATGPAFGGGGSATASWLVRLCAPVLLVLGAWLLFAGSSSPGGAFQSGAVLAGLLILLRIAGVRTGRFDAAWLRPLLVLGVVVFALAAALGPLAGGAWLSWGPGWAFAAILTVETCLTVGIAAGLYLLYLGLANPVTARSDR